MSNKELREAIRLILDAIEKLADAPLEGKGVQWKARKLLLDAEDPLVEAYNLLDGV